MEEKKRNLAEKLKKLLGLFPVVVILGARQCGKTTLAKSVTEQWKYVDLENPDDLERVTHDPLFFFKQFPNHIIFDETQSYPELFNILRGVIDADRHQKGRFILTGSASPELYSHAIDSLAGRIGIIELGTLKANELSDKALSPFYRNFENKLDKKNIILGADKIPTDIMQYLWLYGGYPEPCISQDTQFIQLWLENYKKTYMDRDIARLFPKLNKQAFNRFLTILSKLAGTIINKSDVARALEISEKTVREYLHIATNTFLWRPLPSYENNIIKSVIKMPKGYIRDSGTLHYLLKIHSLSDLYDHPMVGASFEAFIIEEILKGLSDTLVTNWQPYYYRTKAGVEIDLILEGPFGLLPIEIKYGIKTDRTQLRSLTNFVQEHQLEYGILINQSEKPEWLNEQVIQIPFNYI